MPLDPAGTKPGLSGEHTKTVAMRCKNENCDSMEAIPQINDSEAHARVFICVKCHRRWGIGLGGPVHF